MPRARKKSALDPESAAVVREYARMVPGPKDWRPKSPPDNYWRRARFGGEYGDEMKCQLSHCPPFTLPRALDVAYRQIKYENAFDDPAACSAIVTRVATVWNELDAHIRFTLLPNIVRGFILSDARFGGYLEDDVADRIRCYAETWIVALAHKKPKGGALPKVDPETAAQRVREFDLTVEKKKGRVDNPKTQAAIELALKIGHDSPEAVGKSVRRAKRKALQKG